MLSDHETSVVSLARGFASLCGIETEHKENDVWGFSRTTRFGVWLRELWFEDNRWCLGRYLGGRSVIHVSSPALEVIVKWLILACVESFTKQSDETHAFVPCDGRMAPGWSLCHLGDGWKSLERDDDVLMLRAAVDDEYLAMFSHIAGLDVEDLVLSLTDAGIQPAMASGDEAMQRLERGDATGTPTPVLKGGEFDVILTALLDWAESLGMEVECDDFILRLLSAPACYPEEYSLWKIRDQWRIIKKKHFGQERTSIILTAGENNRELVLRYFIAQVADFLRLRDKKRLGYRAFQLPTDPAPGWTVEKIGRNREHLITPDGHVLDAVVSDAGQLSHIINVHPRDLLAAYQEPAGGCLGAFLGSLPPAHQRS